MWALGEVDLEELDMKRERGGICGLRWLDTFARLLRDEQCNV